MNNLTSEEKKMLLLAKEIVHTPFEFVDNFDGKPYNFQQQFIYAQTGGFRINNEGVIVDGPCYGHPMVQMKTLTGWEPSRELADLITWSVNNTASILEELNALRSRVIIAEKLNKSEKENGEEDGC